MKNWSTVIKPKTGWFDINLRELWQYRDLIVMFVKRNFVSSYKQTVLGPLWFIINPLLTSLMYTVVFGQIARISTDGVPQFLYYMAGNTAWAYFSTCLTSTSHTFTGNAHLFGKVYFPRLVSPISTVIYAMFSLVIQTVLLLVFMAYYIFIAKANVNPNITILLVPLMVLHMAVLGMGCGIIISSLTTKYRDLSVLVGFGVQLWMYATPIVYPLSAVPFGLEKIIRLNPMTPVVNNFKYAFLGSGNFELTSWLVSAAVSAVILMIGIVIFSRIEKTFMDTV
ncbi:MAG: ABC transporter permease [Clostridia bacterium]|nr:ABC transporter permease [Clostridia bacterium]